ncbi:Asparagine--tRNA ligase [secondary endosymbiont of Trabutina mannipara]|uniref:Asparagine--tRNA ligase n=1 Tax=secondary endosymbiont of Trabutina mannipara TaxID=1835721 RepID=A0A1C3L3S0_9ENTR|nr:asparagine--tRNA ligase [secondary endosymbiont of Trabutina mannipara]SBT81928.1 Asparagine--tRNA ligase [secondary endosymbiont of Trabutina mannipara]
MILSIVEVLQCRVIENSTVTVHGWVRTRRDSKTGISFLAIYDGSCFNSLQIVINNTLPNYNNEIRRLTTGCSVSITGKVVKSLSIGHNYEIKASKIEVIGWIDNPNTYPIAAKKHSLEYLREVSHLRSRTNIMGAVIRIRHTIAQAIHRFMNENGFLWVSTPLITASNTEGAGEMFRVSTLDLENLPRSHNGKVNYDKDFFGKEAFLTVSGQLNGESYACAMSKIYTFGPIFRAENSNTSRHLAEFWMVEPEIAFATLTDISVLAESMLKYLFKTVLIESYDDIQFFTKFFNKEVKNSIIKIINTDFAQIDYTEAISILQKNSKNFKNTVFWGMDLSSEYERFLAEKYFQAPVIVKNYPKNIKAFYMRINDDEKTVAAMDILVPGMGEIIGGSQREERLDRLDARLTEMGLNKENYWWYRDLRRYGTVPHSGFGLGLERLIAYITGIQNIRDVIPFPRTTKNISF